MKNYFYQLRCISCHKINSEKKTTSVCTKCNGALDVVYDLDYLKNHTNSYILLKTAPQVIKYLDLLPLLNHQKIITLSEGGTPLHLASNLGKRLKLSNLFVKIEGANPTGAFKDRGSFVEINKARELGYKAITVASTGNMAASVAAFAIKGNLACYVFVPDTTPLSKLAQCLTYGANVIKVRGTYAQATDLAEKVAKRFGFYLAGDYAFRLEGQKTIAYEVVEQLYLKPIDYLIVPIGMGTNISSIWKGLKEYQSLGLVKKLPRLIGVQAEGCQPVVKAFKQRKKIIPVDNPDTVASAIACGKPIDGIKALKALTQSDGLATSVSDEDILKGQQMLARYEGIYVEPAAASVVSALLQLASNGLFSVDDRIVLIATGAGLKDPNITLKILAEPPVIEGEMAEVENLFKNNFFAIRSADMRERGKILFASLPKDQKLKKVLKDEFGIDRESIDVKFIKEEVKEFRQKGKKVTKADLQAIIETAIQQKVERKYLQVIDWVIKDTKHGKAQATVELKLNGKLSQAAASGDGPVDAAINALRSELRKKALPFELVDYNVEVTSAGTDASVIVTMVLQDKDGKKIVARQTSPDIIHASIEAFELAYNQLVAKV